MESWFTDYCPKCEAKNIVHNGDVSDMTRPDVDAVRCWNCNVIWSLEDRNIILEDDANWLEDGKRIIE